MNLIIVRDALQRSKNLNLSYSPLFKDATHFYVFLHQNVAIPIALRFFSNSRVRPLQTCYVTLVTRTWSSDELKNSQHGFYKQAVTFTEKYVPPASSLVSLKGPRHCAVKGLFAFGSRIRYNLQPVFPHGKPETLDEKRPKLSARRKARGCVESPWTRTSPASDSIHG
ncbi:hypothetical protein Trydic_g23482 [Trypoxylus dichotomus]